MVNLHRDLLWREVRKKGSSLDGEEDQSFVKGWSWLGSTTNATNSYVQFFWSNQLLLVIGKNQKKSYVGSVQVYIYSMHPYDLDWLSDFLLCSIPCFSEHVQEIALPSSKLT